MLTISTIPSAAGNTMSPHMSESKIPNFENLRRMVMLKVNDSWVNLL